MSKVTVIFLKGSSLVDEVIDVASKGEYSHTAIKINSGTLEALGIKDPGDKYPGVWLHDTDKYTNDPNATFIEVDLPNLAGAEAEANSLIGTLYGYYDCVNGGVYDLTGKQLPADGELTVDCSETVSRVLRGGDLSILSAVKADCITPNALFRALSYQK